jgi:hypothetical protein
MLDAAELINAGDRDDRGADQPALRQQQRRSIGRTMQRASNPCATRLNSAHAAA